MFFLGEGKSNTAVTVLFFESLGKPDFNPPSSAVLAQCETPWSNSLGALRFSRVHNRR